MVEFVFHQGETMKIKVEIKNVYGREQIYPVCEKGALFADLAGTKTLTRAAINTIKKLGYEIEIQQQEQSL